MYLPNHTSFVHLHLHSQYSLLEGAIHLKALPEALSKRGMSACALTDHNNLYGAIEFYKTLRSQNMRPIIGQGFTTTMDEPILSVPIDFTLKPHLNAPTDTLQNNCRSSSFPAAAPKPALLTGTASYHGLKGITSPQAYFSLNLLCFNHAGYKNLIKLSSFAFQYGNGERRSILPFSLLKKHNAGLFAIFPGVESALSYHIKNNQTSSAVKLLNTYQEVFSERVFIEIYPEKGEAGTQANWALFKLAEENHVQTIASNNCFYLETETGYAQYILKLIGQQKTIVSDGVEPFTDAYQDLKGYAAMKELFKAYPEKLLTNTLAIAEQCELDLDTKQYYLPQIEPVGKTVEEVFKEKIAQGFEKKFNHQAVCSGWDESKRAIEREHYLQRLAFECGVIEKMGYVGYFLIVADFIGWAKANGIPVGPGRGSGAGSLVAYSLDITDIDPIPHDLLFERFLNPERISMPDFDIDFETAGRERVIDYVRQKYGYDKVSQISTLGTLQARAAIRGVGRALGVAYKDVDRLSKMIPSKVGTTLNSALEQNAQLKQILDSGDEEERNILKIALEIEGFSSNLSTHAAGVVIMSEPITDILPICLNAERTNWQTQYSMDDIESQGAIKFDFLGLRNLSILQECVRLVEQKQGIKIEPNALPIEDKKVFDFLATGLTTGIFQLEGHGMKRYIQRFRPKNFEELIALVAIYRPGPLQAKMDAKFIDRKDGKEKIVYYHPKLKEILEPTYGVIVYQEQIMRIAQAIAGYSLGGADLLRRAIGKKKAQELSDQAEKFITGARASGLNKAQAEEIFHQIEEFGNYGFNKSHAAAYGLISFQTAYLKVHYPLEFLCSLLVFHLGNYEQIFRICVEAKELGIKILPPDINKSEKTFGIESVEKNQSETGQAIRYGLLGIKGVGISTVDAILTLRQKKQGFKNLFDFYVDLEPSSVTTRCLEAMIKAGAFDQLEPRRDWHVANFPAIFQRLLDRRIHSNSHQFSIFEAGATEKPFQFEFIDPGTPFALPHLTFYPWEMDLLGYPFVQSGFALYRADIDFLKHHWKLKEVKTCQQILDNPPTSNRGEEKLYWISGRLIQTDIKLGDNGKFWGTGLLEDEVSTIEVHFFHEFIDGKKQLIQAGEHLLFQLKWNPNSQFGGRFSVQAILPFDQLRTDTAVHAYVQCSPGFTKQDLEILKIYLDSHPGNTKITFTFPLKELDSRLVLDSGLRIKPDRQFSLQYYKDFARFPLRFTYAPNF